MQFRFLGQKDPLEKEMATHPSTLAWKIPWKEEHGMLTVQGVAKSQTQLSNFTLPYLSVTKSSTYIKLLSFT